MFVKERENKHKTGIHTLSQADGDLGLDLRGQCESRPAVGSGGGPVFLKDGTRQPVSVLCFLTCTCQNVKSKILMHIWGHAPITAIVSVYFLLGCGFPFHSIVQARPA